MTRHQKPLMNVFKLDLASASRMAVDDLASVCRLLTPNVDPVSDISVVGFPPSWRREKDRTSDNTSIAIACTGA